MVKGVPAGGSVGPCSVAIAGEQCPRLKAIQITGSRFFVLSIEEGYRKANRLPVSERARWQAVPGRRRCRAAAGNRAALVKGVPAGASVWLCSVAIAGEQCPRAKAIQITDSRNTVSCIDNRQTRQTRQTQLAKYCSGRTGCRGQGRAGWRRRRAVLDHRPIVRFFVVSIEEGYRKASRLPVSGRARWRAVPPG